MKRGMPEGRPLSRIPGERIRWQYLTFFICFVFLMLFSVMPAIMIASVIRQQKTWEAVLTECLDGWFSALMMMLPFLVFAACNRFFLGKIVCVLDREGIHMSEGMIPWDRVERIEYFIELPSKYGKQDVCRARVIGKRTDTVILHAPLFLLRRAKRYAPGIKTSLSSGSTHLLLFVAVALTVSAIVVTVACCT